MNVHIWCGGTHGVQYIEIGLASVIRVNSTLHADLGRASPPGFTTAPGNLFGTDIVGSSAQILTLFALGEGTELALEITHIGVVNIAIYNVADAITLGGCPQPICSGHHIGKFVSACFKQPGNLGLAQIPPSLTPTDYLLQCRRNSGGIHLLTQ